MSGGQNCAGCERVLIQQSIYDQCLERLVQGAKSLRQSAPLEGDPTAVDSGALALPGLIQNITSLVQDAVSQGAKACLFSNSSVLLGPVFQFGQRSFMGVACASVLPCEVSSVIAAVSEIVQKPGNPCL